MFLCERRHTRDIGWVGASAGETCAEKRVDDGLVGGLAGAVDV